MAAEIDTSDLPDNLSPEEARRFLGKQALGERAEIYDECRARIGQEERCTRHRLRFVTLKQGTPCSRSLTSGFTTSLSSDFLGRPKMERHTEQLVGVLFRVLREKGHADAQQKLVESYQSAATTPRDNLVDHLITDLISAFHEHLSVREEVEVLTTTVEQLLDQFAAIIETAPVAIVVVNEEGLIQLWNRGAERTFGWSEAEVLSEMYSEMLRQPSGRQDGFLLRLADGNQIAGVETQHPHQNGSILDVRLWAAPFSPNGTNFDGAAFIVSDITEQKQREQRLAVLNRVLRHNIRNDVLVIRGHLDSLTQTASLDDAYVDVINERLTNIVELSEDARRIERLQANDQSELERYDLSTFLQDRLERLRIAWPRVDVELLAPDAITVVAHDLFPYAIDNLVENAAEHNDRDSPHIFVRVSKEAHRESNTVTLQIADNGPGLPANEAEILTSETETPLNHSTGTGLWLARWIIRSSNGSVSVESSRSEGTEVTVKLQQANES